MYIQLIFLKSSLIVVLVTVDSNRVIEIYWILMYIYICIRSMLVSLYKLKMYVNVSFLTDCHFKISNNQNETSKLVSIVNKVRAKSREWARRSFRITNPHQKILIKIMQ